MPKYINADELLKDKVSSAYISRFEIELAPAADVQEVVHGKWVRTGWQKGQTQTEYEYKCSVCKRCKIWRKKRVKLPNYCEKCGAKMDEK